MFLPRFQSSSPKQEDGLLCEFARTFGQTRSSPGDAKASGQDLPLIRAFFESLVCCPQARLRTFPVWLVPGTRGSEVCCCGGNFVQGAARTCNGASQMVDEHPWSTKSHTFAVLLLPAFIREFFGENGVAHRHDLMGQTSVQALAMGRQLALFARLAPSGGLIALALLPL